MTESLAAQVARLAMLEPSADLGRDFAAMVAFAAPCRAVAAREGDAQAAAPRAVPLRSDEPSESLPVEAVLQNAPTASAPYLTVPRAVES